MSMNRYRPASLWRGALKRETTYRFVRNCSRPSIVGAVIPTPGGIGFALNDLPDFGEYTALFDAYRIIKVDLTMYPYKIAGVNPSGPVLINLYTVTDPDDATPIGVDAMRQYANFRVTPATRVFRQTIYPKVATQVYNGVAAAYAQPKAPVWIDCANADVVHYGFKWTYDPSLVTETYGWRLECRYFLEFKGTR